MIRFTDSPRDFQSESKKIEELIESCDDQEIKESLIELKEFKNPNNWIRSYDMFGALMNESALFIPRFRQKKR